MVDARDIAFCNGVGEEVFILFGERKAVVEKRFIRAAIERDFNHRIKIKTGFRNRRIGITASCTVKAYSQYGYSKQDIFFHNIPHFCYFVTDRLVPMDKTLSVTSQFLSIILFVSPEICNKVLPFLSECDILLLLFLHDTKE